MKLRLCSGEAALPCLLGGPCQSPAEISTLVFRNGRGNRNVRAGSVCSLPSLSGPSLVYNCLLPERGDKLTTFGEAEKGQCTKPPVSERVVVKVKGDGDLSLGICSVKAWEPSWHSQQETAGSLAGV